MFSERAKYTALSIVGIFETSKPLDPAALVVLSDGAGISYGLSQFTHRSGSLKEVVEKYLATDAQAGRPALDTYVDGMANAANIGSYSRNSVIKAALKAAAKTPEMLAAQVEVATEKYLNPALAACERSGFVLAMTLAVVYDAMNQGGYDVVRDRVTLQASSFPNPTAFERAWTHDFCIERKAWLAASRKSVVRGTIYRPNFFIGQIANGNWDLDLPLTVNGYKLNKLDIPDSSPAVIANVDDMTKTYTGEPAIAPPAPAPVTQTADTIVNTAPAASLPVVPDGPPEQVSSPGAARAWAGGGIATTIIGGIWAALTAHPNTVLMCVVGAIVIVVMIICRGIILDFVRMHIASRQDLKNVK